MSDAIQALNEVVFKAGERGEIDDAINAESIEDARDVADRRFKLLDEIAVIAGDAIEDRVKAADKAKPRKARVYKQVVHEIAHIVKGCSQDTPEGPPYALELIEEVLALYEVSA